MRIFPVFIPFAGCNLRCIYCQQNLITRTGSPEEQEVYRVDFDSIRKGLREFCQKQSGEKKQIAFFGGSFTLLPFETQERYLREIEEFLPCIDGIRVSTRPDGINRKRLDFALKHRINTIELGIQSFNTSVLKKTGRPYDSETAMQAARLIKERDISLGIQLMPGLPGETEDSISETVEKTILLHPDSVRIYPTLVLKFTELERMYEKGLYCPLTLEEGIRIAADMTVKLREQNIKVIKTGLHSDLSAGKLEDDTPPVVAGPYHPAFGELVSREILFRNILEAYMPGKTILLSQRAISLLKRDRGALIEKLKKNLPIKCLPLIFSDEKEKEKVLMVEEEPEFLW